MYAVVVYENGVETEVSEPMGWSEAYANYEPRAAKINYVNAKGEYTQPEKRITIRNLSV